MSLLEETLAGLNHIQAGAVSERARGDSGTDAARLWSKKDEIEKMLFDVMVALSGKEQNDDDAKKAYCEAELDKAEDDKKELEHAKEDLEKTIDEAHKPMRPLHGPHLPAASPAA